MLDPRKAYIDLGNGQHLNARPEIYLGQSIYDFPVDNEKYVRPSPHDINSDEVHRNILKITNNDDYGSVYVVFKIYYNDANTERNIYLGELDVEGQKVTVPHLNFAISRLNGGSGLSR